MEDRESQLVSVVVPVYRCEDFLSELVVRAVKAIRASGHRPEIVLVDDRSPDGAWNIIDDLAAGHEEVVGVRLSRNFGQHAAITAGLNVCCGDKVVVMDGDLQDPPELISKLLDAARNHDVVMTRRIGDFQNVVRRIWGRAYFRLVSAIGGERIDPFIGGYALLDRKVVDAFVKFGEQDRHFLFILRWLGFDSGIVDYERHVRSSGRSSYNLRRRMVHASHGILFQGTRFLGIVVFSGFVCSITGGFLGVWAAYQRIIGGALAGWTSLVALILLTFGILIVVQGVVGLYVGRVFQESKGRPVYVIDKIVGRYDN
jgi:glycosyltransferase involved in cell wall biosynthesis